MDQSRINLERTLFLAAFIVAMFVRFLNLGAAPLSDSEAGWALQAVSVANPAGLRSQVTVGAEPAYVLSTALLFELFGSTDFLARFWPALAGLLLVLAPYLLRRRLGGRAALIAAFGLALDPGLVAVSRQAGGPMMALAFAVLALALWIERRPVLAGVLAGLALLSGPAVYPGLIGLGAAALALRVGQRFGLLSGVQASPEAGSSAGPEVGPLAAPQPGTARREALIAAGTTVLLAGTYFLRYPQGLAAWIQSLVVYLDGWVSGSGAGALKLLVALAVYQPFALVFAIIGVGHWLVGAYKQISKEREPEAAAPGVAAPVLAAIFWLLVSLVLVVAYPGRQVSDVAWVLAPLWLLAAFELEYALPEDGFNVVSLLQAGLILILATLFWITMVSTGNLTVGAGSTPTLVQIGLLFGIIVLGVLTTVLVALGWSPQISIYGATWGVTIAAAIYLISALWGASQLRANQPGELWSPLPGTGQSKLIQSTLDDLSNWNVGIVRDIDILSTVDTPSLRWTLRNYPHAQFVPFIPSGELPAVILTPVEEEPPALTTAYRGQDFVWWTLPGWDGVLPPDLTGWLAFRQAPVTYGKIILWARGDQFPGGQIGSQDIGTTAP